MVHGEGFISGLELSLEFISYGSLKMSSRKDHQTRDTAFHVRVRSRLLDIIPLLLSRLLDSLSTRIHWSLPFGLFCHLLICFRIWFRPSASFSMDVLQVQRTSLLLLSECDVVLVKLLGCLFGCL